MKKGVKFLVFLGFLIFLIYGYGRFINPFGFQVKEYGIVNHQLPEAFHGLKIVQFGDIYYGRTTNLNTIKKLVKTINLLKPDIIIFTGNLEEKNILIHAQDKKELSHQFKLLKAPLGKYALTGQSDRSDYSEIMKTGNFELLDQKSRLIYNQSNTPILITNSFEAEPYWTIGILKQPDNIDQVDLTNVHLALAGYSLQGQIRIPFYGALIKKKGAVKYTDAIYKLGETSFYISNGLGTENISFRFLNKPSFNFFRLWNH